MQIKYINAKNDIQKLTIDEELLKELNNAIKLTVKDINKFNVDYDFLIEIFGKMIQNNNFKKSEGIFEVVNMKKEDTLRTAVNFFKSVDEEFYNIAIKLILQLNKNEVMNIYNLHSIKDFEEKDENQMEKYSKDPNTQYNKGNSRINIPIRLIPKEESKKDIQYCTLDDLYIIVHEISHSFDMILEESVQLRGLKNPIAVEVTKITRDLLTEATAITFEELLTDYLLQNTNYSKEVIKDIWNWRMSDSLKNAKLAYTKLLFVKETIVNDTISSDFIEKITKENKFSVQFIETIIKQIINNPTGVQSEKRYAIGGLIAPTLTKKHKKDKKGADVIKSYLSAIKDNSFEETMKVLGIETTSQGIDKLIQNMNSQIKEINQDEGR